MSDVVNLCQIDHKMSEDHGDGGSNYKPPLSDSEQLGSCHFNKQHISVGKLGKNPNLWLMAQGGLTDSLEPLARYKDRLVRVTQVAAITSSPQSQNLLSNRNFIAFCTFFTRY